MRSVVDPDSDSATWPYIREVSSQFISQWDKFLFWSLPKTYFSIFEGGWKRQIWQNIERIAVFHWLPLTMRYIFQQNLSKNFLNGCKAFSSFATWSFFRKFVVVPFSFNFATLRCKSLYSLNSAYLLRSNSSVKWRLMLSFSSCRGGGGRPACCYSPARNLPLNFLDLAFERRFLSLAW